MEVNACVLDSSPGPLLYWGGGTKRSGSATAGMVDDGAVKVGGRGACEVCSGFLDDSSSLSWERSFASQGDAHFEWSDITCLVSSGSGKGF